MAILESRRLWKVLVDYTDLTIPEAIEVATEHVDSTLWVYDALMELPRKKVAIFFVHRDD